MRLLRSVVVAFLALAVALPVLAAEREKKQREKKPDAEKKREFKLPLGMLEGIELTAEQQAKLEEVKKEFGPKLAEFWKKSQSVMTEEQKKARMEAMKATKEAGKDFKEAAKAVEAAVKLTDEQKAQMAEVKKAMQEVQGALRERVMGLLTDQQKEAIKARMKRPRGEGEKRAKKQ